MKAGDIVKDIYSERVGAVLRVWNGIHQVSWSKQRQYNPYRIMIQFKGSPSASNMRFEHLHKVEQAPKRRLGGK